MGNLVDDMCPSPGTDVPRPGASRLYRFNTERDDDCDAIDRMFRAGIVRKWQYVSEVRGRPARLFVEADRAEEFAGYVIAGDR